MTRGLILFPVRLHVTRVLVDSLVSLSQIHIRMTSWCCEVTVGLLRTLDHPQGASQEVQDAKVRTSR